MLGPNFRIRTLNSTGQTVAASALTVSFAGCYFNSTGQLVWGSFSSIYTNSGTIASGSYDAGSAQTNNTGNVYIGGQFIITLTSPASSSGTITVYLENSDGTTWPDAGNGTVLWNPSFSGAQTLHNTRMI